MEQLSLVDDILIDDEDLKYKADRLYTGKLYRHNNCGEAPDYYKELEECRTKEEIIEKINSDYEFYGEAWGWISGE